MRRILQAPLTCAAAAACAVFALDALDALAQPAPAPSGAAAETAVVAPSDVVYGAWGEVAAPLTDQPGDAARGLEVVIDRGRGNCVACHQITELLETAPFHGEVGPPLDGAGERWEAEALRGIVANAKKTFPDSVMPSFYHTGPYVRPGDGFTGKAASGTLPPLLSAQEVEDVVAYLQTLDQYYD